MRNLVGGVMTPPYEALNNNLPGLREPKKSRLAAALGGIIGRIQ